MGKLLFVSYLIEHLLGYGILAEENGDYYIKIDSLRDYISKNTSLRKKPETKEEKWTTINLGRNRLEEKLRSVIITILKANHGKNAKEIALEIIPSDKSNALRDYNLPILFSEYLFLSDLGKIILKNWQLFEKIFNDKRKFEMYLEHICRYRVDAHAKQIDDDDLAIILIAMNWFESKLDDFV